MALEDIFKLHIELPIIAQSLPGQAGFQEVPFPIFPNQNKTSFTNILEHPALITFPIHAVIYPYVMNNSIN